MTRLVPFHFQNLSCLHGSLTGCECSISEYLFDSSGRRCFRLRCVCLRIRLFTGMGGKVLRIWKASFRLERHDCKPGTLIKDQGLRIACHDGFIIPELLQLEGKQVLDMHAFANGLRANKIMLGE